MASVPCDQESWRKGWIWEAAVVCFSMTCRHRKEGAGGEGGRRERWSLAAGIPDPPAHDCWSCQPHSLVPGTGMIFLIAAPASLTPHSVPSPAWGPSHLTDEMWGWGATWPHASVPRTRCLLTGSSPAQWAQDPADKHLLLLFYSRIGNSVTTP